MALKTSGSTLSTLARAPVIPGNVGKIDAASIYDRVVQGLQTAEALRQSAQQQQVANAELRAATLAAPMKTDLLAEQVAQAPIQTQLLADKAALSGATLPVGIADAGNQLGDARLLATLTPAQRYVLAKMGPATTTTSTAVRQPNGQVLSRASESANIGGEVVPVSTTSMEAPFMTGKNIPSSLIEFDEMTKNLTPEEKAIAGKMNLGLLAKAHDFAPKSVSVQLPDGSTSEMVFNANTRKYEIPQIASAAAPAVADAAPAKPLTMADNPFVSPTAGAQKQQEVAGTKEAERVAKLREEQPKRQLALQKADLSTSRLESDIDSIISQANKASVGLGGQVLKRFAGSDAANIEAALDAIKGGVLLEALGDLKAASPSGASGFGNLTEKEGDRIAGQFGSLSAQQDPQAFKTSLAKVKQRLRENVGLVRGAYNHEYPETGTAAPPAMPVSSSTVSTQAQYDALPSGAEFVTPSGARRRKP